MTSPASAARAQLRTCLLCISVVIGLTACGDDDPAATAGMSSAGSGALVSPRLGMIDRSPAESVLQGPTSSTPPTKTPPVASTSGATLQPGIPPVKVTDGSATLDWTPPTQNSDGTALTNLA